MRFDLITLFPEAFASIELGVTGRAIRDNKVELAYWNPRDYALDKHRTVDDRPYGGGPGMLMKVAPLRAAIAAARKESPHSQVVYLSPQGRVFNQQAAINFASSDGLILVAGRYEGIDQRVIECDIDEEYSIGDYVLSGGELPSMIMMDTIIRLIPGVLGNEKSAQQDSFMEGLLDCPHYTRPEEISGMKVPEVLLSGDHGKIKRWRLQQALLQTKTRRPDLLEQRALNEEEQNLLKAALEAQKLEF